MVKIRRVYWYKVYHLNILVSAGPGDDGKTEGLCGTLTGRCDDDFTLRDGTYSADPKAKYACNAHWDWDPDVFSASWQ